jgi:hypothetical protein
VYRIVLKTENMNWHVCQRKTELMWLTAHLASGSKTIANFRRDSGAIIRKEEVHLVVLP